MLIPIFLVPALKNNLYRHILIKTCNMFKVVLYLSVFSFLSDVIFFYHIIKFSVIYPLNILKQICCSIYQPYIFWAVICRLIFTQVMLRNSCKCFFTCYRTLAIAYMSRVWYISHRHLSFLIRIFLSERCGYHLGSAIDDSPLAVSSRWQNCGGSPRVLASAF